MTARGADPSLERQPERQPGPAIAVGWGPTWFRRSLILVAGIYLAELALGSNGWSPIPDPVLGPLRFFSQGACLFPDAAQFAIEYRVEAWSCVRQRFESLDYRADFPMHASDKESRFYRAANFYHTNRTVMHALEAYLVQRHNERVARGEDTVPSGLVGGIRLLSLRIPFPRPGEKIERYQYHQLAEYPDAYRKDWYFTPPSRRLHLCAGGSE